MDLLSDDEGELALRLARGTLDHVIGNNAQPDIPLTPVFSDKRGVFVTLTIDGDLRGCIGFPYPVMPLGDAIAEAATAAALQDPRFLPVKKSELTAIRLEVTVLTVPVVLEGDPDDRPAKVIVGRHGLIVKGRGRSGLLLPQVATEYGWSATEFLDHTCIKAGFPRRCWDTRGVEILTFEGQIYTEER